MIIDDVLAHAAFEERLGTPKEIVARGVYDRIVESLARGARERELEQEVKDLEAENAQLVTEGEDAAKEHEETEDALEAAQKRIEALEEAIAERDAMRDALMLGLREVVADMRRPLPMGLAAESSVLRWASRVEDAIGGPVE